MVRPIAVEHVGVAARKLAAAVALDSLPVCVYGSEELPAGGTRTSAIIDCVAAAIFRLAADETPGPLYATAVDGAGLCRCAGGAEWFGYSGFDPYLVRSMSTAVPAGSRLVPKRLKSSPSVAEKTYASVGTVSPLGQYTVFRRCDDPKLAGEDVKCVVCFGTAGQIRDLCGLAHFRSPGVLGAVEWPWGPSCATLITFPAGMSARVAPDRLFIGPADPSARSWLPEPMLAAGLPAGLALTMARDVGLSFLSRPQAKRLSAAPPR